MKKTVLISVFTLLIVTLNVISCKQNEEENKKVGVFDIKPPCNYELAAYLLEFNDILCDDEVFNNHYKFIFETHIVDETVFKKMYEDQWGNGVSKPFFEVEWKTIKGMMENKCYEEYLTFKEYDEESDNSDLELTTTESFNCDMSCYSYPLFRSIEKIYAENGNPLKEDDKIKFTKAFSDKKSDVVIFTINDQAFFDISNNPRFIKIYYSMLKKSNK